MMPSALSYPGVCVEGISSGVRTITAVPTLMTAVVGRARKGPVDNAVEITSYRDFARIFGGISSESLLSYAVSDFYSNGGAWAVIARVFRGTVPEAERDTVDAAVQKVVDAAKLETKAKDAKAKATAAKAKVEGHHRHGTDRTQGGCDQGQRSDHRWHAQLCGEGGVGDPAPVEHRATPRQDQCTTGGGRRVRKDVGGRSRRHRPLHADSARRGSGWTVRDRRQCQR
jgi:hypothetical protein